jgi:acylphosphatase
MTKARITVDGMVQGSGYRALVKSYANRRGISGLVRNLNDGKVEIFCEGTKDSIEQLIKDINVKGTVSNPLSLNVDKINIQWEGEKGFEASWKPYIGFEIDYGPETLTQFERENLESLEWAKLRFSTLERGIYCFRDETNDNFNLMANKYGSISTDVNATKQEIKTSLDQLPDRIGESLTRHLKKLVK